MMDKDEEQSGRCRKTESVTAEVTRRLFLRQGAAVLGGMTGVAGNPDLPAGASQRPGTVARNEKHSQESTFLDVLRVPDMVTAFASFKKTVPTETVALQRKGDRWRAGAIVVQTKTERDLLVISLAAPSTPIVAVHVRWRTEVKSSVRTLGDAWERSYGELGWRNMIPERAMPWYFATHDGLQCHGYGVRTDARSLCFWQLDPQGVSLWLNAANGGEGVRLGDRELTMATVVTRRGVDAEDSMASVTGLCRAMCARPSRSMVPIYGANDWCYSYGLSTAQTILHDTEFIVELSPSGDVRPFSVIDGGWSNGTAAWPDMSRLADDIKKYKARPGIWTRPLEPSQNAPTGLLLPATRFGDRKERARETAYDPTIPEAQDRISAKMRGLAEWGYEMVKHDFTTYDLLGQWGFEMGPQPTLPGWSLHDQSKTNAEVIAELYALLRGSVGEQVLLDGCNTVGHLGQGVFDLQRTGDDTSGHQWERTRRMGVNTLAFRLPQHGSFFTMDADVVGITDVVPWELNRQWLDMLAHSGTATLVSAGPPSRGRKQRAALKEAFQIAATGGVALKPVDWMETSAPERWQPTRISGSVSSTERRYHWSEDGISPFLSS